MKLNLIGPVNSLSYGVVTKNILQHMFELGHEVALHPLSIEEQEKENFAFELDKAKTFNPNDISVKIWHQFDMNFGPMTGKRVGLTIFELNVLTPKEVEQLNTLDHLCVCSKWAADVCKSSGVTVPISVVPLGVDRTIFNESNRETNPDITKFCVFGKAEYRKGHDIIPLAFSRAFKPTDKVCLHISIHNPFYTDLDNKSWSNYYRSMIPKHQLIIEENRLTSQKEIAKIMNSSNVNIAVSRAEGWNLELLEAMSCGCYNIATDYSAHTEFATNRNSKLIKVIKLEDAIDGFFFRGFGQWACLDDCIDKIAEEMVELHKWRGVKYLDNNEGGIRTAKEFSWRNTTEKLIECL